jgi:hypothetical protein
MCDDKSQLNFALHTYAKAVPNGCGFKGKAKTQSAAATPTGSGCPELIKAAGAQGTGIVSGGAPQGSGSSGSGGSASGSSGQTGAAVAVGIPQLNMGVFGMGLYVVGAMASGMALILL